MKWQNLALNGRDYRNVIKIHRTTMMATFDGEDWYWEDTKMIADPSGLRSL